VFWKLYEKAGQPGWAAIVPAYSQVIMGKIVNRTWVGVVVGVMSLPLWLDRVLLLFKSSSTTSTVSVSNTLVDIVIVALLVFLVLGLYLLNKFIKAYDRNIGYWFLYLFIPIIGMFLVNKATFKGNGPQRKVA
jgi:hypothetical protein